MLIVTGNGIAEILLFIMALMAAFFTPYLIASSRNAKRVTFDTVKQKDEFPIKSENRDVFDKLLKFAVNEGLKVTSFDEEKLTACFETKSSFFSYGVFYLIDVGEDVVKFGAQEKIKWLFRPIWNGKSFKKDCEDLVTGMKLYLKMHS